MESRSPLADRTLPDLPRTSTRPWPDDLDPSVRSHLDVALGTDDNAIALHVADLITSGPPSDDAYLDALRRDGYRLSDEDDETMYEGPTLMVAGRADRIAGFVDQFGAMSRYPRGSFAALDGAGHYLPFECADTFAALFQSWLGGLRKA